MSTQIVIRIVDTHHLTAETLKRKENEVPCLFATLSIGDCKPETITYAANRCDALTLRHLCGFAPWRESPAATDLGFGIRTRDLGLSRKAAKEPSTRKGQIDDSRNGQG